MTASDVVHLPLLGREFAHWSPHLGAVISESLKVAWSWLQGFQRTSLSKKKYYLYLGEDGTLDFFRMYGNQEGIEQVMRINM